MSVIKAPEKNHTTLSIGAVSQATGIPVETLRTWERRYGFPSPDRSDGGHRQYNASIVEHLNLISRAIEQGHRPGQVVGESTEKLGELIELSETEEERRKEAVRHSAEVLELDANRPRDKQEIIDEWFTQIRRIDHENFPDSLERHWLWMHPAADWDSRAHRAPTPRPRSVPAPRRTAPSARSP